MYQTKDGKTLYFIDQESCVRRVDRTSGEVETIIGGKNCIGFFTVLDVIVKTLSSAYLI